MGDLTAAELREEVIRLGPWHMDVEITPEVSTSAFLEAPADTYPDEFGPVTFHSPHDGFLRRLRRAFPNGLEGRSVLDCACNCGAYLFFAKEAEAGRCLGFDAREHWIRQARFLAEHRRQPSNDMRFEAFDLYDLPSLGVGRFDVTFFFGIFYHLPDPVSGLKLAADLTDEVLILNGATKAGLPDGLLVAEQESPTRLMSGKYGLCWFPTGPRVLGQILSWLGFPEFRCSVWRHAPRQRADLDRVEVIAARTPGFFADWDKGVPEDRRVQELIETRTPPGATVIALQPEGDGIEVASREMLMLARADDAIGELDRLPADGARYVLLAKEPTDSRARLDAHLAENGRIVADEPGHRLYELPRQE
jgi:tRNA (mo5U34)-methyltransferase